MIIHYPLPLPDIKTASVSNRSGFFIGRLFALPDKNFIQFRSPRFSINIPANSKLAPGLKVRLTIQKDKSILLESIESGIDSDKAVKLSESLTLKDLYQHIKKETGLGIDRITALWEGFQDEKEPILVPLTFDAIWEKFNEREITDEVFLLKHSGFKMRLQRFFITENEEEISGSIRHYYSELKDSVSFIFVRFNKGRINICNIARDSIPLMLYSNIQRDLINPLIMSLNKLFAKDVRYSEESVIIEKESELWRNDRIDFEV